MTGPNYLDHVSDEVLELFRNVQIAIIDDAGRRFAAMGELSAASNYQLWRAQQIGASYDYILDEMAKGTGLSREMLSDLFNDAGVKTLRSDDAIHRAAGKNPIPLADSPHLQNILLAGLEQTLGTFRNLSQSAAYYGSKQLGQLLDEAWLKITSGGFSYDKAIREAITKLSKSGVAAVQYLTAKSRLITNNIDVVIRRATLSGINQAACKLQMARMREMGTEFVETTAHAGARDAHAVWQGKIFQLVGNGLYPNFYEATGYGTVAGLGGANCRHGFYPYYPGISKPANSKNYLDELNNATVTYRGQELRLNEAFKIMRANEREIREIKRTIHGLDEAGIDSSFERGELKAWQAAQKEFCDETGLRRDYTRERAGKQYAA